VKKTMYTVVLILGVWLMGCTPYQTTLTNEERSYPATVAGNVQIFLQGETTPAATEVGQIVILDKSEKEGIEFLKQKAAEIGADGVINVEVKVQTQTLYIVIIPIPVSSYYVSGTAIKINKQ
jgi:uncharacterized protein YbjQ (UPF0145 family)